MDSGHDPILRQRRLAQANAWIRRAAVKDRHFAPAIFAGVAWNLFLDLYAARLQDRETSVAAACVKAQAPTATALRWIDVLIEAGFVRRLDVRVDMRRTLLGLTDKGVEAMDTMLGDLDAG